ncbi:MAG TPA: sugar phosphate isomerase/epimerase [Bryobacteraceae bacterium]|jgi:sugar phosphate isomerase/epimerase|nr:sugar phosphate isomerase/epimerase [Bryobacteraceae bacterium]
MKTRREFGKVLLAGIPAVASCTVSSRVGGVEIGLITYSLRSMPAASMIPAIAKIGLSEVELMSGDAEALAGAPHSFGLSMWRSSATPKDFHLVRKKFTDAGIDLRILCFNMPVSISDAEIDYAFRMAQALQVKVISSSSTVAVARRVAPFAAKYKIIWAAHGHDNVKDPEQFATPEVFAKVVAMGPYMGINLDIGHFTAAGFDAVSYIKENHAHITHLHLKDRKKSPQGQMTPILDNNFPWGEGDTPICDVLQLLKREHYNIPANVEFEYAARAKGDAIAEVERCFDYAKKCLA